MTDQVRVERPRSRDARSTPSDGNADTASASRAVTARGDALAAIADAEVTEADLAAIIDEVEADLARRNINPEEFVRNYVQQGGE